MMIKRSGEQFLGMASLREPSQTSDCEAQPLIEIPAYAYEGKNFVTSSKAG